MNKHFYKYIRDNMPESLKYVAAPFIRNRLIRNREFSIYYKFLQDRESLSSDKIQEFQFNQLKSVLKHAYQNVPYYSELFDKISFDPNLFSDFKQMENIPFLTREIIMDNFDKLIARRKVTNGYFVGKTGGSTGLQLKVLLDINSVYKENAFIYYFRKKLGYNLNDRLATFRAIEFGNCFFRYNPMHNEMIFSPMKLSKVTLDKYVKKINDYNPQYLNGYLSSIWYFAKLLEEYQKELTIKLKGIFLISENIDNKQRRFVEDYFKVKSSTFYGHTERCVIADEIIPDRYQFDPYYGYTEQIPIGGNSYAIVGTGFLNSTMPLIRYKTDDICSPHDKYYSIEGKRSSMVGLFGYSNEFLSNTAFDLDKEVFKNITTYQFVQTVKGKADLLIIVNKHFQDSEMVMIENEIKRQTKGIIDINIKIVDSLLLSPRGKYQMYISRLK